MKTYATTSLVLSSVMSTIAFTTVPSVQYSTKLYSENPNFRPGMDTRVVENQMPPGFPSRTQSVNVPPPGAERRRNAPPPGGVRGSERELEQRLDRLERLDRELKSRLNNIGSPRRGGGNNDRDMRGQMMPTRTPAFKGARDYNIQSINEIWESSMPITVQGGSLRTWSYANPAVKRVYVLLKTDGRPLNSDIELWQGPDNTPHKMKVYVEDGGKRTFSAFLDTPRSPNTICIKNSGHLEFPLYSCVGPDTGVGEACVIATDEVRPEVIQGGALRTYPFEPNVDSVAVVIKTDGRPLNARIELLQGPNNNKQIIELYTEDGLDRPFMAVIQTPGSGNVVRVVNSAPIEFPMYATVAPFELLGEDAYYNDGIQIGQEW